ncbi:hypothetical protein [Sporosarcina limicola]|uniref:Uncharacterized protein n=1 Tax=Sporosarcina limicola TaxID=34101 RepID=A0A927MG83_9BACL|nr:hypothetical protein [Sporosarcina limicola]MBE1554015.1 hypothetical protein [Sporosarcina limicola]
MSYDLMTFETSQAPQEKEAFMTWYEKQVEWKEGHGYNDARVCSPALQNFYNELTESFPNMNGNIDDDTIDAMEEAGTDNRLTDYGLGTAVIYAAFAWSVAEEAYTTMRTVAQKHKVGFFDVSGSEGEIIFP